KTQMEAQLQRYEDIMGQQPLRAQTATVATGIDLSKIQRYVKLEMYQEAGTALEAALKADEFNGELRYLYGVASLGLQRFDDATKNLTLALRLDSSNWRAREELILAYLGQYKQSGLMEPRIRAFETANGILSVRLAD